MKRSSALANCWPAAVWTNHRALVAINAAHLLVLSGITTSLAQGVVTAEDVLRSGAALASRPAARTAERGA
ncbi:hypothetical protein FNH05_01865 [Amycolatopsis rhizosphaerae]|uniref:Uncharacterized protein n=1 Tax=Amycolatopsis rhizosphaerae TaxID=2053003 RepID=A0A558DLM7_9PSEU|nr:hypothetical protein [Amycolatopsis rhizosphaerae]TVT61893.1 hypothetical protein FNH05_01865 [Amycolatopsis rhizosphaerae]